MNPRRIRALIALSGVPFLVLGGASPSLANCPGGGTIYQGFGDGRFTGCGTTAYAFIWQHQRAVQRLVSGTTTNGPAGVDGGANSTVADGLMAPGSQPGDYTAMFDWRTAGTDGCTTAWLESDTSCATGIASLPVNDFVIAGRTVADPYTALAAIVSVDGNEIFSAWILDNAGAPSIDGDPCGADAYSFKSPPDIACGAIPRPNFDSVSCNTQGCTVGLSVAPSAAPILDDCEVAHSRALNCTGPEGDRRNLLAGRQLFWKKAPCLEPPADTRSYVMSTTPFPGTATANFTPYSVEDGDLDGTLDAGEDGASGGTVDGRLDPFILPGNALETRTVFVPSVTSPGECVYLAIGLALDINPIAPAESVITPLLSLNPQAVPTSCTGADADDDGFTDCEGDCDDGQITVYPGAPQICDGINNDCDDPAWPALPAAEHDDDADAYLVCQGDCNDANPAVHPGASETCNGIDDDCDAMVDEDAAGEDSDGDLVHNLCDNCPSAYNPGQTDSDGDLIGNSCDNCITVPNADQADRDADARGDLCDNCPDDANTLQDDTDADGVGDVCDNCIADPNPAQANLDADSEGDACDLNDGLILITVESGDFVSWQMEEGFSTFNEYRGDLSVLRASGVYTQDPQAVPLAGRACDLFDPYAMDDSNPALGQGVFHLVTGNAGGIESSLGTDSQGAERPNTNPCPGCPGAPRAAGGACIPPCAGPGRRSCRLRRVLDAVRNHAFPSSPLMPPAGVAMMEAVSGRNAPTFSERETHHAG